MVSRRVLTEHYPGPDYGDQTSAQPIQGLRACKLLRFIAGRKFPFLGLRVQGPRSRLTLVPQSSGERRYEAGFLKRHSQLGSTNKCRLMIWYPAWGTPLRPRLPHLAR